MSKKEPNLYEGMYMISATLSDDARNKALEKIQSGITEKGGEILKVHDWGRRRLEFPIEGRREGHYYILYFKLDPAAIEQLWAEYHLNEDLMRFITLRTEEVMEEIAFKPLVEAS